MAELEFRDGKREVPDHLLPLLRRIETFKMTYEDALAAADRLRLSDFLNGEQARVISAHMRDHS